LAAADLMAATEKQKQDWEGRFEHLGESAVRADVQKTRGVNIGISNDEMLQVAFAWLRRKEQEREARELRSYAYLKWTLVAAITAVAIGIAGLIATIHFGH
jgi:hypothetical protein